MVECELCGGNVEETRYVAFHGKGVVGECCIHKKELGHFPISCWIPVNSIRGKEILEEQSNRRR